MKISDVAGRINQVASLLDHAGSRRIQREEMNMLAYLATTNLPWSAKAVLLGRLSNKVMNKGDKKLLMIAWGLRTRKHRRWFRALTQ